METGDITRTAHREMQAAASTNAVIELTPRAPQSYIATVPPELNAFSNGAFVIDVDENSSLPDPDAPPPYSSLGFEQQRNENNVGEPPSYDEAIRSSTTT